MPVPSSAEELLEVVRKSEVVEPPQLQEYLDKLRGAATGLLLQTCPGGEQITGAAFTPDGRQVVFGGYDRTLRLWGVPEVVVPGQPAARNQ